MRALDDVQSGFPRDKWYRGTKASFIFLNIFGKVQMLVRSMCFTLPGPGDFSVVVSYDIFTVF